MLVLSPALSAALGDKIQRVYDNGTDKADFLRGKVPEYTWRQTGMNVMMPSLSAAVLYAQLKKSEEIIEKQRLVYGYYDKYLTDLAERFDFELPLVAAYNDNNCHVYYLLFDNHASRERVREKLKNSGVDAFFHYMPLHSSEMGHQLGYTPEDLPITQNVAQCILRLPIYAAMTEADCAHVVSKIQEALC